MRHATALLVAFLVVSSPTLARLDARRAATPSRVTLSIVGTTDLHGSVFPRSGRGGLALFGGFVNNLRAARDADGGAVLLLDAGDTYQGGIESNLTEGALVVDAYNVLGYNAAAIGNHDFDFGPVDRPGARQAIGDDPRGALRARAAQARYPMLAANLIDEATGHPVEWPNVRPSVLIGAAGIKVGVIGVMTIDALRATLPANVHGLRVSPIVPAISREARDLRARGAAVVIVTAHAGGSCAAFGNPVDLSSCDVHSEIFEVARQLPSGLVDVIVAGHTHEGLAHRVAGIAIIQAFSLGRAFARADVLLDRGSHRVVSVAPYAPTELCVDQDPGASSCAPASAGATRARYEGRTVVPDERVIDAMAPALARVRALQAMSLNVALEEPFPRTGDAESPLGNLFADALRERTAGADVAFSNNARGGLRADLPDGIVTFGRLYDVFPFDNRVVTFALSGADLRRALADEVRRDRRGALGVSGLRVKAGCSAEGLRVDLLRPSGQPIRPDERLIVVAMDAVASGQLFGPTLAPSPVTVSADAPVAREVVEDWLRSREGPLNVARFVNPDHRRWDIPANFDARCP